MSCHMPGHKGHGDTFPGEVLKYDITEIDGFDNLHDAAGVIKASEVFAAGLYGSEETHFLVNGSTVGVLSSILGTTSPGDEILITRNCHRSVYNAVMVNRLRCRYIFPSVVEEYGFCAETDIGAFREALERYPDVRAAVITSPTYEGVVSDVDALAAAAHERGVILIVDAAHGAHFGFYEGFPLSAVKAGADLVINSVHKTLPSPTQTALLHINGTLVDREAVRRMLKIYQSSSPSYLLMAGIDDCMSLIAERKDELFGSYLENLSDLERRAGALKHIRYLSGDFYKSHPGISDHDPFKLVLSAAKAGITGRELYDELRLSYDIQPEMAAGNYCLLIMTIMDGKGDFDRLINALECIDEKLSGRCAPGHEAKALPVITGEKPVQVMQAHEALAGKIMKARLSEAAGKISGGYIMPYPPGIPILVPGEEINNGIVRSIEACLDAGLNVIGITPEKEIEVYG